MQAVKLALHMIEEKLVPIASLVFGCSSRQDYLWSTLGESNEDEYEESPIS